MGKAVFILAMATATWAHAQDSSRVGAIWDDFLTTCTQMMLDPEGYVASFPVPGPAGEQVISRSPEGQALYVDTLVGDAIHSGLIYVVGDRQDRGCTFSLNAYSGNDPDLQLQTVLEVFRQKTADVSGLSVIGGLTDKQVPTPLGTVAESTEFPYHEYWMTGLVPGVKTGSSATMGDGFVSFYMHRTLYAGDPT